MKKSFICIAFALISMASFAQRANQKWYNVGIGARFEGIMDSDGSMGLSFDKFLTNTTSFEVFALSNFANGVEVSGIYKYIKSFPGVPASIRWYAGAGVHGGTWANDKVVLGLDGLLGIGYSFKAIPINCTFDWHPKANLVSDFDTFHVSKFGITIRYIVE